jgi:hypothetical protein
LSNALHHVAGGAGAVMPSRRVRPDDMGFFLNVQIPDAKAENVQTVQDAIQYIKDRTHA